jgi:hypothetical protein
MTTQTADTAAKPTSISKTINDAIDNLPPAILCDSGEPTCPACGNLFGQACDYMPSVYSIYTGNREPGEPATLTHKCASYEAASSTVLYCEQCDADWGIPDGWAHDYA